MTQLRTLPLCVAALIALVVSACGPSYVDDGDARNVLMAPHTFMSSVCATASDDIWASGSHGAVPVTIHFDGHAWSRVDVPGDGGVACGNVPNDAWTATDAGMQHWDGHTWTATVLDHVPGSGVRAFASTAPDDAWVIAGNLDAYGFPSLDLQLQHWDGTQWHAMIPVPALASAVDALRLWSGAPDDVWIAIGAHVFRYTGGTLATVVDPPTPFNILALWGRTPDEIFLATERGVFRWNGTDFTEQLGTLDLQPHRQDGSVTQSVGPTSVMFGSSAGDLWVARPEVSCHWSPGFFGLWAGEVCDRAGASLFRWDGAHWIDEGRTPQDVPAAAALPDRQLRLAADGIIDVSW